jgi:hypothetical protein
MTAFLLITIGHVTFSCHASNVGLGAPITGGEVGESKWLNVCPVVLRVEAGVSGWQPGSTAYRPFRLRCARGSTAE